jgi:hypothetical protein
VGKRVLAVETMTNCPGAKFSFAAATAHISAIVAEGPVECDRDDACVLHSFTNMPGQCGPVNNLFSQRVVFLKEHQVHVGGDLLAGSELLM